MKVKNLPIPTLRALGRLIQGHDCGIKRTNETAYAFLQSAGLDVGELEYARMSAGWTEDKLQLCNSNEEKLTKVILHIVDWMHFLERPELFEPTLNRLQLILAPAGWTVEMDGITPYLRQMPSSFRLQKQTALPMSPTPEFSKIHSDTLWVKVLRERWDEAERCIAADAPVMAIVALGSVLEGALSATVRQFPRIANQAQKSPKDQQTGRTKDFKLWSFWDFVEVAHELGWIGAEVQRIGHALRDYRNLVHPAEQVLQAEFPTQHSARTCREAIYAALSSLIKWRENQSVTV